MSQRRPPVLLIADDDDDEATWVDLAPSAKGESRPSDAEPKLPTKHRPPRASLPFDDFSDDDEPTELFLPHSSGSAGPAQQRGDAAAEFGRPPTVTTPQRGPPTRTDIDVSGVCPPPFQPSLDDAPPIRRLDALAPVAAIQDPIEQTQSQPKLIRRTFSRGDGAPPEAWSEVDLEVEGRSSRNLTRPTAANIPAKSAAHYADDDDHTVLSIDAPRDATVFIDGNAIGSGPQEVRHPDRYARVSVRVHRPGFSPWSSSIAFAGRSHIEVRPDFSRRR